MKISNSVSTLTTLAFFLFLTIAATPAQIANGSRLLTVNHTGDADDLNAGDGLCRDADGRCTLRAAIQESNATAGSIIIFALPSAAVIELTRGELLITKSQQIIGPGGRNLTVRRSLNGGNFRIFHIAPNAGNTLVIRGFNIRNGAADGDGGGVLIETGNTVSLIDLAVSSNTAQRGAAIANAGTLSLTRSTVNSNSASNGGGFINLGANSTATVSNSTFTDNAAAANGGAFYNEGTLSLVNDTISGNAATVAASGIANLSGGTINILNTIVGTDSGGAVSSLQGAFNSLGNNFVTDSRSSTGFTNEVNGDQIGVNNSINPLLGALTNNGGQTDTRALQSGSLAIDRGSNCVVSGNCPAPLTNSFRLSSEQRENRPRQANGTVDIGAFEVSNITSGGSFSFAAFPIPNPRFGGALLILTNVRTNEKSYRLSNPFGGYSFSNLGTGIYVLENKNKRANLSSVRVFDFGNLSFGVFRPESASQRFPEWQDLVFSDFAR